MSTVYVSSYHLDLVRSNAYDQLFTCADYSERGFLRALDLLEWTYLGFLMEPRDAYFRKLVEETVDVVFETFADRSWTNIHDLTSVAYMRCRLSAGKLLTEHVLLERVLNERLALLRRPRVGG